MRNQRRQNHLIILFILGLIGSFAVYFFLNTQTGLNTVDSFDEQNLVIRKNSVTVQVSEPSPEPVLIEKKEYSPPLAPTLSEKFEKALQSQQTRALARAAQTPPAPSQLRTHPIFRNTRWQLWPQTSVQNLNDLARSNTENEIARLNNFIIVYDKENFPNLTEFSKKNPQAVYDRRRNQVGILTGTIRVTTSRRDLLEANLNTVSAEISDAFDAIQTYFIVSQVDTFDLQSLFNFLSQQSHIQNIELEILSRTYEKK